MKKNDWILLTAVLSYSFLFYEQFAGINFLLFNLLLILSLFIRDRQLLQKSGVCVPLAGALLSAVCIVLYGDGLSVFANIVSLSMLAANSMNPGNSMVTVWIHAAFSYVSAPFYVIYDAVQRRSKGEPEEPNTSKPGFIFYLIPAVMVALFFMFYRGSNVLFENLTNQIRLDFISIGWIFFTMGGALLLYAFYYNKRIGSIAGLEAQQVDHIEQTGLSLYKRFGFSIELSTERKSGIMMLAALNLLILVVNILDMQFLVLGSALPPDMTYSELVHQGVGSLIMSILTAIGIILWYFKGEQNFTGNKVLKTLAYVWIAQNVLMIATSGYKNFLYIEEAGLTYKRIGVFVYLLLAVIGLLTTWYKLRAIKSGWYLCKTNTVAWYIVLILFCFVNWDLWIVRYNITRASEDGKELDVIYLASLSEKVIPDLYPHLAGDQYIDMEARMEAKMFRILDAETMVDWRSWNADRKRLVAEIEALFNTGQVDDITITIDTKVPAPHQIRQLRIINPSYDWIPVSVLSPYSNVVILDLSETTVKSLQGFPALNKLQTLDLSDNEIRVLDPICSCLNLVELNASRNTITVLPDMSRLQQLKRLNLSHNDLAHFEPLSALHNLEYLNLSYTSPADFRFLEGMKSLKILVVSQCSAEQLATIHSLLPDVKIEYPRT